MRPHSRPHVLVDDTVPSLVWERPAWWDHALCRGKGGSGVNKFFPDTNNAGCTARELAEAYCWRCPVRSECEEAGRDERFGVWGGRLQAFGWRKARMDRKAS